MLDYSAFYAARAAFASKMLAFLRLPKIYLFLSGYLNRENLVLSVKFA